MDSYQPIYDAVRSKISGGDIGQAVSDVARNAFDISWARDAVQQELIAAAYEWRRPSVVFRPSLLQDGAAWCALFGDNLQEGVAGFGDTPEAAMTAFDQAWWKERTPAAIRAERDAATKSGTRL